MQVKVIAIDDQDRVKLSRKQALREMAETATTRRRCSTNVHSIAAATALFRYSERRAIQVARRLSAQKAHRSTR